MLGFRDLVQTKTAAQISRILRILQETTKPSLKLSKSEDIKYLNFSDTTVRIIPVSLDPEDTANYLFWEILNLVHIQAALFNQGILLRGAVSIGRVVKSWSITYGPGLVRSYELEQSASVPRIILDPKWFEEPFPDDSDDDYDVREILEMLSEDDDGRYFIDYLRVVETELDDYPKFLKHHATSIAEGLVRHSHNRNIFSKFNWLRRYHNRVARKRYGKRINRDLLV